MKRFYDSVSSKKWFNYIAITFGAILFVLGVQSFVQVAHTFTAGVSAISLIPAFIIPELKQYVSLIYLGLNIPLILYFWNKIKRSFILKTTYFLIIQSLFSTIFLIPGINEFLYSFIVDFNTVLDKQWPIFVMSTIGGIAVGFSIAITWKFGGSSGGGDIITYYISTKKKRAVGNTNVIVSLFFLLISFIVTIVFDSEMRRESPLILVSTIAYIFINKLIINKVYPKYNKISVEIHSYNVEKLSEDLKKNNYHHSWQIINVKSGFTGQKRKKISTVMLLLEFKEFKKDILKKDPNAWLHYGPVTGVIGNFDTSKVD